MKRTLVLRMARAIWDVRETGFPQHTRMTWQAGTREAKLATIALAEAALHAAIAPTQLMVCAVEHAHGMAEAAIAETAWSTMVRAELGE